MSKQLKCASLAQKMAKVPKIRRMDQVQSQVLRKIDARREN